MPWLDEPLWDGDGRREHLGRSLVAAKRFLDTTSVADLVGSRLGADSAGRALLAQAEIDHIGFLAPPGSGALLAVEASRAGFSDGGIAFPSVVVARELTARAGRPLPATVVKHFGHTPRGRRVAVELFVVAEAEGDLRRWITQGVGMHVAVEIGGDGAFARALEVLPREGLSMPAFADDGPRFIASEGVTLAYFELAADGGSLRLEVRARGDHTGRRLAGAAAGG